MSTPGRPGGKRTIDRQKNLIFCFLKITRLHDYVYKMSIFWKIYLNCIKLHCIHQCCDRPKSPLVIKVLKSLQRAMDMRTGIWAPLRCWDIIYSRGGAKQNPSNDCFRYDVGARSLTHAVEESENAILSIRKNWHVEQTGQGRIWNKLCTLRAAMDSGESRILIG